MVSLYTCAHFEEARGRKVSSLLASPLLSRYGNLVFPDREERGRGRDLCGSSEVT